MDEENNYDPTLPLCNTYQAFEATLKIDEYFGATICLD